MTDFCNVPITHHNVHLQVKKGNRVHDIVNTDGLKMWFTVENVTTSDFIQNAFKECRNEGKLALTLDQAAVDGVAAVDAMVYEAVLNNPDLKTVENTVMTPKTWDAILKKSLSNTTLWVTSVKGQVAFFDKDKQLLDEKDAWTFLKEGTRINCVVEPCFVYVMTDMQTAKRRAGVTWKLRQVRFLDEFVLPCSEDEQEHQFELDDGDW